MKSLHSSLKLSRLDVGTFPCDKLVFNWNHDTIGWDTALELELINT